MNPFIQYLMSTSSSKLQLGYTNSRYFRVILITTDNLPIIVDFGDGVMNSISSNSSFSYDAGALRTKKATISTPARLKNISAQIFSGQAAVNWDFSIATLLICKFLIQFDFRSGNVFGNSVNLSSTVEDFTLLSPSYGTVTGSELQMPSNLKTFFQQSTGANYQHTTANVGAYMLNLNNYRIAGVSKLTGNIGVLPANLTSLETRNTGAILHECSYYTTAGSRTWATNMNLISLRCAAGKGLSTAMLDALLIDLDATTWLNLGSQVIRLIEGHGIRSAASNAAVTSLSTVKNVVLQLN